MDVLLAVSHVAVVVWLVFGGGADRLDGSIATSWLFVPSMTAREIKFWAYISLVPLPFYLYL